MRKTIIMLGIWVLMVSTVILAGGSQAAWAAEDNFLFSAVSNNTWALDMSTRQLIFIHYDAPQKTWETKPIIIPDNFNLDTIKLKAVGARGTSAFLFDTSLGLVMFYSAQDEGSIVPFKEINIKKVLK
jgi:hypothetical protein